MEAIDRLISAIAATQTGNISRLQLLELGLSHDAIDRRIRRGLLHRVFPGIYHVGRPATTPLERAAAAVLACGDGAALSHASAMTHWGFWSQWDTPFEVTIPVGDRRPHGIRVHRSTTLERRETVDHRWIRVTRPARTIFDVAPRLKDDALARTVNNALLTPYLFRSQLAEQLYLHPRHPGAKRLRPLIVTEDGPTRSDWERAFPAFCKRYGLPRPLLNRLIGGYEADAYWPNERLIVQLDGWKFHSDRHAFETDRDRDAEMLVLRIETVRITWDRMRDTPLKEAKRLRAILAARRRELAALSAAGLDHGRVLGL